MSQVESQIIVVSAFGRGHWVAADLAQKGIKSTLVDVSSLLGVWPAEDIEGPFGLFRNERMNALQLERLNSEDAFQEISNGFTIWLPEGPIELKGPLSKFKIENSELHSRIQESLQDGQVGVKKSPSLSKNLRSLGFQKNWLLHLSHQIAGTTYISNARGAQIGSALPLFAPFLMRNATRFGVERSIEWLQTKGVTVIRPKALVDIAFSSRKQIEGVEIGGEAHGVLHLDHLIWTLSSEETHFVSPKIGQYFFPIGALNSEWSWVRYRLQFEECFERDHLPGHCLLINDLESPWTHENFIVLQKTGVPDQYDAWARLPSDQRFNKEYLVMRGEKILSKIRERVIKLNPQILSYPQEYYYTYSQLGAPRYPVYGLKKKNLRGKSRYRNLHLDGPEVWKDYSWNSYFSAQEEFSCDIEQWWKNKLLKEAKNARKDLQS